MNKENLKEYFRNYMELGNRFYGGLAVMLGGIFAHATTQFPEDTSNTLKAFMYAASGILIAEGVGDLITGQHHYLTGKLFGFNKSKNLEEKI